MKKAGLFFLAFLFICPISAQKVLKPIRTYLKANNGTEALKLVEKLEKDSVAQRMAKLYDYGKQAQILINNTENEKIYLKQSYDTAKFFSSTLGIHDYILKCEREEQRELAENGQKMKFHRDNSSVLHYYYANINAGARYFYSKKNYAEAMKYFAAYLDLPQQPIWGSDKGVTSSAVYTSNAYFYQKSAFLNKNYDLVPRYKAITLADTTTRRSTTLEYLALAAIECKDTTNYIAYLRQGLEDYPHNIFFFTHLADYYAAAQDYKTVLTMADSLLQTDSLNVFALEAKSLALMSLQRYDEAIIAANTCLDADTTQVDAYFYAGAAYYNKAIGLKTAARIGSNSYTSALSEQKSLYEKSRIYLEKYRQLCPDEKSRWAPLLYQIYFSLNLGKQFEEISKIAESIAPST